MSLSSARLRHRMNYLHYGDALSHLSDLARSARASRISKNDVMKIVSTGFSKNTYLAEVVRSYHGIRSRTFLASDFVSDCDSSREAQVVFRNLGCRGFSHELWVDAKYRSSRPGIDIQIVLLPAYQLFYPPKVHAHLRTLCRRYYSHFSRGGYPCIAFALGRRTLDGWYILSLQSDVAFRQPSALREHFRGWRKVLFHHVVELAREEGAAIHLPRGADVARACVPGDALVQERLRKRFELIYDRTARDFRMGLVRRPVPHNIQVGKNLQSTWERHFYRLSLDYVPNVVSEMVRRGPAKASLHVDAQLKPKETMAAACSSK